MIAGSGSPIREIAVSPGQGFQKIIERADVAREERLLPLGLSSGAKLKRPIETGEAIGYADVEVPTDSFVYKIRQLQDESVKG